MSENVWDVSHGSGLSIEIRSLRPSRVLSQHDLYLRLNRSWKSVCMCHLVAIIVRAFRA